MQELKLSAINLATRPLSCLIILEGISSWWQDFFKVEITDNHFTKRSDTLKQFVGKLPTNCLSVFDHFVGLALKGLTLILNILGCLSKI